MKMNKLSFFFIFATFLLAIIISSCTQQPGQYDNLAKCLVTSGTKMYGTWWCPHCSDQKKAFGSSWDIMKEEGGYVECANADKTQTKVCVDAGIKSYPTWRFPDGSEMTGKLDFYTLAEKSGCQI